VCRSIDDRSEIWINSTGHGITVERLLELKEHNVNAIMFSLHHDNPDDFNCLWIIKTLINIYYWFRLLP